MRYEFTWELQLVTSPVFVVVLIKIKVYVVFTLITLDAGILVNCLNEKSQIIEL